MAEGRVVGLMAQLYQVRSAESWGVGDLGDLADLATWAAAAHGADFVLINPLHAAEPVTPMEPSPYLPTTRRFVNPLYLRVEDVPELARLEHAAYGRVTALAAGARALNRVDRIDRDAAWLAKKEALRLLFDVGLTGRRERSFVEFCDREGDGLTTYATWCALVEEYGMPWRDWADELQDPSSAAVATFRERHATEVDFHRWLQWLLEQQLAAAQHDARTAGMSLGIVHDLAVGVHPLGADAWGLGDALARGVTVGAPPDQFNQLGQDWSQPPWRPDRLAELGYAPFRDMVRTVLRDSGGIRVDHIIGLFRLWWIPTGDTPARGHLRALRPRGAARHPGAGGPASRGRRHRRGPRRRRAARARLHERARAGRHVHPVVRVGGRPAQAARALPRPVPVDGHHARPAALGRLPVAGARRDPRAARAADPPGGGGARAGGGLDRAGCATRASPAGCCSPGAGLDAVVEALHRWMALTPSRMLAVALADVVGDHRAVNQPGTNDEYPNWRVPLAGPDGRPVSLEDVREADLAPVLFAALRGERPDA